MHYAALALLILFSLAGLAGVFLGTFGTLLILTGAVLFAWMTQWTIFDPATLGVLFVLFLVGEVLEYFAVILGSRKLGASKSAVLGAVLGGIVGTVIGAGVLEVGIIAGAFVGIFAGAFFFEYLVHRDFKRSVRAGFGGVLGQVGAIALKLVITFCMYAVMVIRITQNFPLSLR